MATERGETPEMQVIEDAERSGRTDLWPFWRRVYATGDPLPKLECAVSRPTHQFDAGDELPDEYRALLIRMLRHEGERAGNKSFLGFMATCLDIAEALFPTEQAKLLKAEYLAFFVDLNGAFHSRDWRESSYLPLRKMAATVERDELGHSEMGYHFLTEICQDRGGRALAQKLLDKWYPAALEMFGRSDSPNVPRFIHWGLKSVGNAEIRQAYKQYVDAKIAALGLELPDERKNRRFV